ncbi:unnamed protein product [Strongylus vulgaris]|uniref:Membrane transporter protein n=1 Tax=Strongylus vulgaris TaxID=40348 RepID=A0A3P7J3U6_STRVU|nr:unnamed protein product [Strongylus vulgaris]
MVHAKSHPSRCIKGNQGTAHAKLWRQIVNSSLPLKFYFDIGQHLEDEAAEELQNLPENPTWHDLIFIKYRKFVAMLIPFLIVQSIWWMNAIRWNFFRWYPDYWHMPVTMLLGSFVGGTLGAIPGFIIGVHFIDPLFNGPQKKMMFVAIWTAFAIALAILNSQKRATFREIPEFCFWKGFVLFVTGVVGGTLGAIPGFIIGVHFVNRSIFNGPQKKMMFVAIWTAFAIALAILNSQKRATFREIPEFCFWKGFVLFVTGFVGGVFDAFAGSGIDICIFSIITLLFRVTEKTATPTTVALKGIFDAFAGSGIDICIFSIITLLFRVTEKTATPTTVALKGINAVIAFYYRAAMMADISEMAWKYFALTIPVASAMGPLGSFLGSHLHRQAVASFVYILEAVALIGFLFTKPGWQLIAAGAVALIGFLFTKPGWQLIAAGGCIILGGFVFFSFISKSGQYLLNNIEEKDKQRQQTRNV